VAVSFIGGVIGFTPAYAISAYHHHHWCCKFESISGRGVHHYVITFFSDLRHVGGFHRFPPPIKLTATIITEILLKVASNTIKQTTKFCNFFKFFAGRKFLELLPLSHDENCLYIFYFWNTNRCNVWYLKERIVPNGGNWIPSTTM
jgi:hypothetical protein